MSTESVIQSDEFSKSISHVFWRHLRQTYCQHSLHRQTFLPLVLMLRLHRFEQSSLICTHCWQFQ